MEHIPGALQLVGVGYFNYHLEKNMDRKKVIYQLILSFLRLNTMSSLHRPLKDFLK